MKFYTPIKLSENISQTPEGYLLCANVPIARTGEMVYAASEIPVEPDEEGKIVITRDEDAVFDPICMASFEGKSFTINHPEEFVSPDNWTELTKGTLRNVRRGDGENKDDLLADILVTDAVAIGLVNRGMREVSCGYDAEYIQIERGRGKQTSIIGNHCALVDKGRAGQSYAITDHDRRGSTMSKFKDKFKAMFTKTMDDAMKEMKDEDFGGEPKKEESKDEGVKIYDELKTMMKDMADKIEGLGKGKDEFPKKDETKKDEPAKEEKSEDDQAGEEGSVEDRLKFIETALKKLMGEESEDEDMEEAEDDEGEEMPGMTGDSFARAEILCPGIKRSKDMKAVALKAAYNTKDGKAIIDTFTGGKKPTFDSAAVVDSLFIAASEILKVKRSGDLSKTKQVRERTTDGVDSNLGLTADEMNARNAKFYNQK